MELKLTEAQYKTLLKSITISSWITSILTENDEIDVSDIDELEQYILSQSEEFNSKESVFFDEEMNTYFATQEIEESVVPIIDTYEEYCFWDEITHRLARRDLIQEEGEEAVINMDPLNRMELEEEYLVKYSEEFSQYGIHRLTISN
ncbi:MAG: hypothetical protein H7A24_13185 [Leptospiraceae bacterium]|nr:hypothetical protein [Leptospiraceae bacterium]MCP5512831.1 hypothetical protein [Leptospiraceae bacterium]